MSLNLENGSTVWKVFVFFVVISSVFELEVNCLGTLQLKLIRYNNPGGKGNNGHCCDGRSIFCESGGGCDHYFIICVDAFDSRDDSMSTCPIGRLTTNTIHNQASVNFATTIGSSTRNPIGFNFTEWRSGVRIKVQVWDEDAGSDDLVDFIKTNPSLSLAPARSSSTAVWTRTTLSSRTSMVLEGIAFCAANWFGEDCSVFCEANRGPEAVYTCDDSGRKICTEGWTGESCDENIDDCAATPCGRHGHCEDELNSYTCHCLPGYEGVNCETNINECLRIECLNGGTCLDRVNAYTCLCIDGYRGDRCDEFDACLSNPCLNDGSCSKTGDGFSCSCESGWTGQRCQLDIDECSSDLCGNNSIDCENTNGGFSCTCLRGWSGATCDVEVDECQSDPCSNNGSCVDAIGGYLCLCTDDWSPESDCLEPRSPVTETCGQQEDGLCKNNGTCIEIISELESLTPKVIARCQCSPGWTGVLCEESLAKVSGCSSSSSEDGCINGGICVTIFEGRDGFQCRCPKGFSGIHCQLLDSNEVDDHRERTNGHEKDGESFISWKFEGHLTDSDLSVLQAFIVNTTTKGASDVNLSMPTSGVSGDDDEADGDEFKDEAFGVEFRTRSCASSKERSTVFLFRLKKGKKFLEKSDVEEMIGKVSAERFRFLSPGTKFLPSREEECIRTPETALMASAQSERNMLPVVIGCLLFIAVVASVVAATVYVIRRRRRGKLERGVSNPIYERGTEVSTPEGDDREAVRFTFDRDTQRDNSDLFLVPNSTYEQVNPVHTLDEVP